MSKQYPAPKKCKEPLPFGKRTWDWKHPPLIDDLPIQNGGVHFQVTLSEVLAVGWQGAEQPGIKKVLLCASKIDIVAAKQCFRYNLSLDGFDFRTDSPGGTPHPLEEPPRFLTRPH